MEFGTEIVPHILDSGFIAPPLKQHYIIEYLKLTKFHVKIGVTKVTPSILSTQSLEAAP